MGTIPGANDTVCATVVDGSGNLYIGGGFIVVGDAPANRIAKWDGNRWSALGSGVNDTVWALAVSDSGLYAGGDFTIAGGKVSPFVARAVITSPANVFSPPFLDATDFVARFAGAPGVTYTIEGTDDVSPANWQKVTNLTAPTTDEGLGVGVFEFRHSITDAPRRFYRTVYPAY